MHTDITPGKTPPRGTYNVNWDGIDENTDPNKLSRPKLQHSPAANAARYVLDVEPCLLDRTDDVLPVHRGKSRC